MIFKFIYGQYVNLKFERGKEKKIVQMYIIIKKININFLNLKMDGYLLCLVYNLRDDFVLCLIN